jgi:hypothetical protein
MNPIRECVECYRRFDLNDALDADEFYYGHDCEEPVADDFWMYIFEIRELLALPVSTDCHLGQREAGPETPDERMATIEHILVCQLDLPWPIDYIRHIDVSHRPSGHWVDEEVSITIQPAH